MVSAERAEFEGKLFDDTLRVQVERGRGTAVRQSLGVRRTAAAVPKHKVLSAFDGEKAPDTSQKSKIDDSLGLLENIRSHNYSNLKKEEDRGPDSVKQGMRRGRGPCGYSSKQLLFRR